MFLHSEVLRYSSSASTIRPLFEYLFTPISGYDFQLSYVLKSYYVTVVFTIYTYMQCGDEIGSNLDTE